jgi:hypothetical protein
LGLLHSTQEEFPTEPLLERGFDAICLTVARENRGFDARWLTVAIGRTTKRS